MFYNTNANDQHIFCSAGSFAILSGAALTVISAAHDADVHILLLVVFCLASCLSPIF